ncbi:MAG: hypothetical protein LBB94_00430 [Clostridiales bacterium]|jgi:hypothetical protein|nr:hypothetical protein [Clostridiales bacterium]
MGKDIFFDLNNFQELSETELYGIDAGSFLSVAANVPRAFFGGLIGMVTGAVTKGWLGLKVGAQQTFDPSGILTGLLLGFYAGGITGAIDGARNAIR